MSWITDNKGLGPWDFEEQRNKFGYLNNPKWVNPGAEPVDYTHYKSDEPQVWDPKNESGGSAGVLTIHRPCGHWHKDTDDLGLIATPWAYWKFENGSGTRRDYYDGHHLSVVGNEAAFVNTPGIIKNALYSKYGYTTYFKNLTGEDWDEDSPISMAFWIYPHIGSWAYLNHALDWRFRFGLTGGTCILTVNADHNVGEMSCNLQTGNVTYATGTYDSHHLNADEWSHIAITSDGYRVKLHVNGVVLHDQRWAAGIGRTIGPELRFFCVAYGASAGSYTYVDEFGIWKGNLTEDNVSTLYNSGDGIDLFS